MNPAKMEHSVILKFVGTSNSNYIVHKVCFCNAIQETFEKLVCEKERIELVASELRCQLEEVTPLFALLQSCYYFFLLQSRGELNSKVEFTKRLLMQRREVGKTIRKLTRVIEKVFLALYLSGCSPLPIFGFMLLC
jgi:hypothetical protein